MSRTETARRLTTLAVDNQVEGWSTDLARLQALQGEISTQLESLSLQQSATAESMAAALLPVAESMARLTEETRQTLGRVVTQSQQGHRAAVEAVRASGAAATAAANDLRSGLLRVDHQVTRLVEVSQEAKERTPVNPWVPALVVCVIQLGGLAWIAWMLGLLGH